MRIQINTDNHITGSEDFNQELTESLKKTLGKFEGHITTAEVYLRDENSAKGGADDKKCSIEARLEGMKPVAVTHNGATLREAFSGASKKIERVVRDSLEKQRENHKA